MKRVVMFSLVCLLTLGNSFGTVYASSLDDLVSQETVTEQPVIEQQVQQQPVVEQQVIEQPVQQQTVQGTQQSTIPTPYDSDYMQGLRDATNLSEPSAGAAKINEGTQKICSFIVQVISYFVVAALVVVVSLDLCYICIPFTRELLAPGAAAAMGGMQGGAMGMQGGAMGMGGPGMMGGGMGMGGMGMGRYGGGMGMGRMGMGSMGMGSMGMGGMGSPMGGGMQGQGMVMGQHKWVSEQAIRAVSAGQVMGPDGKPKSPLMSYASDMAILLVLTPILFTLAVTGVLTDLGFLLGEILANAIASIGNMF